MDKKQIASRLREILNGADTESDSMVNRKKSALHDDDIEVLLSHISLLVADLRFNEKAALDELFEVRRLLEE